MAEIRSVSVHLDADIAGYVAKMRLAGTETDKAFGRASRGVTSTNTSLKTTETQLGKVSVAERKLGKDVDNTSNKANRGAKDLDRYGGRLGLLGDAILALGPALIPIGAVAIPAVAALGTGFLFAAVSAGVAKLAFSGVGNALTLANKAALVPTAENLVSANRALKDLKATAADGLLPGAEQGLRALRGDLPILRHDIGSISGELGILARDTGRSLSSDRWKPFLRFVGTEAPRGLGVMGRSVGNVAHGLAELVMAFLPSTQDLERGILAVTKDFDRWAASLGKTQGFQSFLEYVDTNGPKVLALLGATATAFIDIVRAAAPLGGPILDTLTTFLHIIDAIAKSNLGPPLFVGITAMRLMARTTQLWGKVSATSAGKFVAGQRSAVAAIRATLTAEQRAVMTTTELAAAQQKTSAGWATIRGGALKAGAAGLGFGLIASGVTDKLHLTNTATLAMAGSLAGPWGAAVGGAVGLALDFAHHQDSSAAATTDFTSTLNQQTGAITTNTRAMAAQVLQQDGALTAAEKLGISTQLLTSAALGHADAQAKLQAQLDYFTGVTQPGYIAGGKGMNSIDQAQALAAGKLSDEFGKVSGTIQGNQADFKQLNRAVGSNVKETSNARAAHIRLARSLEMEQQAALDSAKMFQTLGKDLDNAKVSLNGWIRQMQHEADALVNFGNNARSAADKGLRDGLIKQLETLGPAGALRMRQLANATQTEIAKANHAFDTYHRGAQNLIDANAYLSQHPAILFVKGVPQSLQQIRAVQAALAAIRDKTVHLTTVTTTGGRSVAGNAEGGTIRGQRYPYADRVLTMLAPGEEVISNRYGQADRHRPLLKRINARGMAGGGTVGPDFTGVAVTPGHPITSHIARVNAELHHLELALKDSTKELDRERAHRDALAQQRQQLVQTVKSGFMTDIFGTSYPDNGIWSNGPAGLEDPNKVLRHDIRDAREYRGDLRKLKRRGLAGGALAQVTTLDAAQQALGLSPHELRETTRLFRIRNRVAQGAGADLGNDIYGRRLAESNRHLDKIKEHTQEIRHEIHDLTQEVKHLKADAAKHAKAAAANAKTTEAAVGSAINGAASTAVKRRTTR
jgi:hypothetical protein